MHGAVQRVVLLALLAGCLLPRWAASKETSADIMRGVKDYMVGLKNAKKQDLSRFYLSAKADLGVRHCALQGVLRDASDLQPPSPPPANVRVWDSGDLQACQHMRDLSATGSPTLLHLMLRMVVLNATAYIKGVALLEPLGRHLVSYHYLSQHGRHEIWNHKLQLWSQRTRKMYGPLTVSMAKWVHWEGWHTSGEALSHIEFQPIPLEGDDRANPELEVHSDGFGYTCFLVASDDSPLGALLSKATTPMRLEPNALPPRRAPRTIFLMSGFYMLDPKWCAKMLMWHMAWHKQYDVDLYVLYMSMDMLALLESTDIQWAIENGHLAVVHWDVMGSLASPLFTKEDRWSCLQNVGLWNQIFIYNHFMISMWMEEVVVTVVDVDEWLMSPQPKTIHHVMTECAPRLRHQHPRPLAFLSVKRRLGYCKECGGKAEIGLWPEYNRSSLPEDHFIRKYVLEVKDDDATKPKSIYHPALTLSVDPYVGVPVEGSMSRLHPLSCAYWLHMSNLLYDKNRAQDPEPWTIWSAEFWPARKSRYPEF